MADFKIVSEFLPKGDQPDAINSLVEGINKGDNYQTLLGVTGSGKTFTMAKLFEKVQDLPYLCHTIKHLAAQLHREFKQLFP
jgi:Helicase subunit of the DNA excision repair complex